MLMIKFKCSNCETEVRVDDEYAGKKGRCPHCRTVNAIPAQSDSAPPPAVERPVVPTVHPVSAPQDPPLPIPAAQIDTLVNVLRPSLGQKLFGAAEKIGYLVAAYGFLVVGMLAAVSAILQATSIAPVRHAWIWIEWPVGSSATTLVIMAFLMVVSQYVLAKIRSASLRIISTSHSSISSRNLLDCVAVLLLLSAVAWLVAAIVAATKTPEVSSILTVVAEGLLGMVVLVLIASLALNPEALNVSVRPHGSAAGEALGLVSFVTKLVIRALPLWIGGMIAISAVKFIPALLRAIEIESGSPLVKFSGKTCVEMTSLTLQYLLAYVVCLFYHLFVDTVRAVFKIRDHTRKDK